MMPRPPNERRATSAGGIVARFFAFAAMGLGLVVALMLPRFPRRDGILGALAVLDDALDASGWICVSMIAAAIWSITLAVEESRRTVARCTGAIRIRTR